jgi:glucosyl-3-phosphoglycerate synthase
VSHRHLPVGASSEDDLRRRDATVGVVLVARNEAGTIGDAVASIRTLHDRDLIDRLVVIDGGSTDGTQDAARAAGAEVVAAADVLASFGPVLGKGDSMWRAVAAVETDVLAFLDADLTGDYAGYVVALVGPLLTDPATRFVKGGFRRTRHGEQAPRHLDGGRVTEMVARPLLNLLRPDLAAFYQPLGGQVAARRADLASIPVLTGYAVEISMLATAVDRWGRHAVVEADLGSVVNRERTVEELVPMAQEVMYGLLSGERPPVAWRPYTRPTPGGVMVEVHPHAVVVRPPIEQVAQAAQPAQPAWADSRRSDIGSS